MRILGAATRHQLSVSQGPSQSPVGSQLAQHTAKLTVQHSVSEVHGWISSMSYMLQGR